MTTKQFKPAGSFIYEDGVWVATSSDDPRARVLFGAVESEANEKEAGAADRADDFAKIVRASNGKQVLFWTEPDTHDNGNILHCRASLNEGRACLSFGNLPDEAFAAALGKADTKMADQVLAQMAEFGLKDGDA